MGEPAAWKADLAAQLRRRDQSQCQQFQKLISEHNRFLKSHTEKSAKLERIERELASALKENESLKKDISLMQNSSGGSVSSLKVQELEGKLYKTQEELTTSYRENTQLQSKLLKLTDEVKECEEQTKAHKEDLEKKEAEMKELLAKADKLTKDLEDKGCQFEYLKDEYQLLQLELVQSGEKNSELAEENQRLLKMCLDEVEKEAKRMNEANQFYLQMEQLRTTTLMREVQQGGPVVDEGKESILDSLASGGDSHAASLPTAMKRNFAAHESEVHSIDYAASGTKFASGGSDKVVKTFDALTGKLLNTYRGCGESVMCVSFSSNEEMLLGSSSDESIRIWNASTGRIKHTLTGHTAKIYGATFSYDCEKVISGCHDRTLKLWDLSTGFCKRTVICHSSCNDVCVSKDGNMLASAHLDCRVRFWDARTGDSIKEASSDPVHSGQVTSVSLSPNGWQILTNSRDNTLKLIDLRSFEAVATFSADKFKSGLNWARSCFSPDGQYVAAGSQDGELFIWNTLTTEVATVLKGHGQAIADVSWSSLGYQLSTCSKDGCVAIWE